MSDLTVIARWECSEHGDRLKRGLGRADAAIERYCMDCHGYIDPAKVEYVPATRVEALKARLRQEVDAHRMTLHEHALPFTDEEWQGYLGTIPGFGE